MIKNKYRTKPKSLTPMIYEKTRDGEAWYDVFSRLVKDRIVFLPEEINAEVATTICGTLLYLNNQNHTKDISLYINSPGGTLCDGLFTIYDTMQHIEAPIKTVCVGEASSAAAIILAAGSQGKRLAFENSLIMIHHLQAGVDGSMSEMKKMTTLYDALNDKVLNILSAHTGQSYEKIKADSKEDKYFSAQEALEYGLIDGIVKKNKQILPAIKINISKKKTIKN